MHIALLKESLDTPEFVRFRYENYTSLLEGWALYCERLGIEFGLYDSIYEHMGRLEMEMWRAVRLVVDTGLHAMSWTRDMAIAYMKEHTSLPDNVITSEIDRYIGMPAQALAYKLGEMKFTELREYAEQTAGASFDLRRFHDLILGIGAVTLPLLDQLVKEQVDTGNVFTS